MIPRKNGGVDSAARPDEVLQVAYVAGVVYALTLDGRLRSWDVTVGAVRDWPGPQLFRMAADGSVAVSVTRSDRGSDLEAHEVPAGRTLARRRFDHGASVLAVARDAALLEVGLPPPPPAEAYLQILPPATKVVLWELGADRVRDWPLVQTCDVGTAELSSDGARILCFSGLADMIALDDRTSGRTTFSPPLAPDWPMPRDPDSGADEPSDEGSTIGGRHCPKCGARFDPPNAYIVSALLAPDGNGVLVTYRAVEPRREWRLARWTPVPDLPRGGHVERLATQTADLADEVLAASADGAMVVTGGRGRATTVRRRPRYDAEHLPVSSANAAAFSADGARLVTGHQGGALFVWDAATLHQLAARP